MKKNSNAYQLIKSLTMSEKRYFKIFSERHTIGSQNKYVVLFDAIDEIDEENDEDLKKKLRQTGINADFLSADKNYLYQLLLRSLNDFHTSKTFNITVKELLLSIEILFHKGLYQECLKLIDKAQKQAEECENFPLMLDILTWKKKCTGYSLGLMKAAEVNQSMDHYLNLFENLKKYTDLYYESNILQVNTEKYPNDIVTSKFKEILKNPLLKKETNALSFSAKIFFHLIYSNYYLSIDNKQKELEHLQELVNILNNSKSYSIENPLDYVSIYSRFLNVKKYFQDESFFDDIKQLKIFVDKVPIRKDVAEQRIFIHTNTHELEYYLITNNFSKALHKNTEIEKGIVKLSMELEPYHMIYFYYLNAVLLIFVGQYHKALKYINKAINEFDISARPQVFIRLEVLNIILHFELKNYSLASSLVKQVLRKNKVSNVLQLFEEHLLTTIAKITAAKTMTLKEENHLMQELLDEIDSFRNSNNSQTKSLFENYEKWITAKIKRKTVSELYRVVV